MMLLYMSHKQKISLSIIASDCDGSGEYDDPNRFPQWSTEEVSKEIRRSCNWLEPKWSSLWMRKQMWVSFHTAIAQLLVIERVAHSTVSVAVNRVLTDLGPYDTVEVEQLAELASVYGTALRALLTLPDYLND